VLGGDEELFFGGEAAFFSAQWNSAEQMAEREGFEPSKGF
jgi:hypothetical protein